MTSEPKNNPTRRLVQEASTKRSSYLFPLLYSLALAGYPLVAGFSTLTGFANTPLSVGYRISYLMICILVIFKFASNRLKITRGWIWFPIIAFWFLYLLRLSFDTYLNPIVLSREPYVYWLWGVGGCVIPMFAFMGRISASTNMRALYWSFVSVMLSSLLILLAFANEMYRGFTASLDIGRLSIDALNSISVGHLGGTLIILSTFILVTNGRRKLGRVLNAIYLMSLVLGLGLILSAASRGPMVATMFSLGVFAISKVGRRGALLYVILIASLFITTIYFATVLESTSGFVPVKRVSGAVGYSSDASVSIRRQSYQGAWQQFLDSPVIGSAIEERTTGFYPHNIILEAFMATGIIGGVLFLSLLGFSLTDAWKILRRNSPFSWIAMLFLQYCLGAMFSGALWASSTVWVLMAGVLSVGAGRPYKRYRPIRGYFDSPITEKSKKE